MSTTLLECEHTGRDEGLAAGLAMVLTGASVEDTAPGRYAAVPARDLPAGATRRTHSLADRDGIVFLECPGDQPRDTFGLVEIGRRLAAVRLGVLRRSLDLAVEHLTGRFAGDEPLIRKQLVTGAIADVIAGVELLRACLRLPGDPTAVADVHTRLDDLGWQVTKLFGASGYVADHPVRALYVSALVANTWIDREPRND